MGNFKIEWVMGPIAIYLIARFLWDHRYGMCKKCDKPYVREMRPGNLHFKCYCSACGEPKK